MRPQEGDLRRRAPAGVWLLTYLDLLLLLLTLFVFLVAMQRGQARGWERFRQVFAREVSWSQPVAPASRAADRTGGAEADALLALIRQMAVEGVNRTGMERFLERSMIRSLGVREGARGLAVALPSIPGKGGPDLTSPQTRILAMLVEHLPYELEVCAVEGGVGAGEIEPGWRRAFERACRLADRLSAHGAPRARIRPCGRVEGAGLTRFQLLFREVL